MIFHETKISGVYLIEPERAVDERGFFARTWCRQEFESLGLETEWAQNSVSFNSARGTLRGMHYQCEPYAERKLVRCTQGAIYDVLIDLRPESSAVGGWQAFELTADNHWQLYIPEGVAHGFQTLTDNAELSYQISAIYRPEAACGVRFDDPAFGIEWPLPVSVIAARDRSYGDFYAIA